MLWLSKLQYQEFPNKPDYEGLETEYSRDTGDMFSRSFPNKPDYEGLETSNANVAASSGFPNKPDYEGLETERGHTGVESVNSRRFQTSPITRA